MVNSYTLKDYLASRERDFPLSDKQVEAINNYLRLYGKSRAPKKSYDGKMGDVLFPFLKHSTNYGYEVRQQLKRGIADRRLTKCFYRKEDLLKGIQNYGNNFVSTKLWNRHVQSALQILRDDMVRQAKLEANMIETIEDLEDNLSKMDTSAGILMYGKKKRDLMPEMVEECLRIRQQIDENQNFKDIRVNPALCLTRQQVGTLSTDRIYVAPLTEDGEFKYKQRIVQALSGEVVAFESQIARPLINHLSRSWEGIAMGKEPHRLREIIHDINDMPYWITIDYKQYDSTVQAWLITAAFDLVKEFFDEDYHKYIDWICWNFINTEILMPDGNIYVTKKGIPSGSYFTQIIGSICNAIMLITYMNYTDEKNDRPYLDVNYKTLRNRIAYCVLGDDNVFGSCQPINKDNFEAYMKRMFGLSINFDKDAEGRRDEPINFLKRYWEVTGESRDEVDLLLNLLHPERERKYDQYSPWHLLYGYFLTYRVSMERMGFYEHVILQKLNENGGSKPFLSIPREDLPGSLSALASSDESLWKNLIYELQHKLHEDTMGMSSVAKETTTKHQVVA